ncbi:uncharacterized protein GGQ87_001754 [Brevundimonas alba]|uniref:DUF418 domain-containing protein n=1 Tax=Brevundimonas alba TaxID=74314 RepID=A0A7X6BPG7_9CAUL|nr:DUF418 domain-containing protein [Brevundimonas alba]NJC41496.1 uncharacterized protein [Brevundimonas alba]
MTDATLPTAQADRIGEVDIIRGFALFGVLWMNVLGMGDFLVPADKIHGLTELPTLEKIVGFASHLLMGGKAQALFSMLFGFGFAIMMERIGQRGGNGTRIYLRRLTVLLIVGLAHVLLLWMGDILNAYAAMGFLLLLTRKWPGKLLLAVGVFLAGVLPGLLMLYYQLAYPDVPPPFLAIFDAGAASRWPFVMGHDYPAFVVAMFRGTFFEFYGQPIAFSYLGWILGRFMIGSWIFRQGWLQAPQRYLTGFSIVAATFIPLGLMLTLLRPIMKSLELKPMVWAQPIFRGLNPVAEVILALGYGALIIILCQLPRVRRFLSGLGSVGQMALTNYLTQSAFFFVFLYGFGFGLLPWMGPTLSLAFALVVFAVQIVFSRWWLGRYAYGPAEWLWRWATYGVKPALKRG